MNGDYVFSQALKSLVIELLQLIKQLSLTLPYIAEYTLHP